MPSLCCRFITDTEQENGLAAAAHSLIIAAEAAKVHVQVVHLGRSIKPQVASPACRAGVNVLALNPQALAALPLRRLLRQIGNTPTVASWHWELAMTPPAWRAQSRWLSEVWAPSAFVKGAFAAGLDCPVVIVPPAIVPPAIAAEFDQKRARPHPALPVGADDFVFLTAFNPASCAQRKNPFGVIRAFELFQSAHGSRAKHTRLLIKTQDLARHPAVARALHAAAARSGALIVDAGLAREQRAALWARADAFVSLHRSEGFGLTLAEGMALGRPVIASACSGNTDFTRPDNSWLVNCAPRPIGAEDHQLQPEFAAQYVPGALWAEPDLEHAADQMAQVFAGGASVRQRAENGRRYIAAHYAPAVVGAQMRLRLEAVLAGDPPRDTRRALIRARRAQLSATPVRSPVRRWLRRGKLAGLFLLERL